MSTKTIKRIGTSVINGICELGLEDVCETLETNGRLYPHKVLETEERINVCESCKEKMIVDKKWITATEKKENNNKPMWVLAEDDIRGPNYVRPDLQITRHQYDAQTFNSPADAEDFRKKHASLITFGPREINSSYN